jgi:hypothetical protein
MRTSDIEIPTVRILMATLPLPEPLSLLRMQRILPVASQQRLGVASILFFAHVGLTLLVFTLL